MLTFNTRSYNIADYTFEELLNVKFRYYIAQPQRQRSIPMQY